LKKRIGREGTPSSNFHPVQGSYSIYTISKGINTQNQQLLHV